MVLESKIAVSPTGSGNKVYLSYQDITSRTNVGKGILDSGATVCITGTKKGLKNIKSCMVPVKCADNKLMVANLKGDLDILVNGITITLVDVLYIEGAPTLISVHKLVKSGKILAAFCEDWCLLTTRKDNAVITKITLKPDDPHGKLYTLYFQYKDYLSEEIYSCVQVQHVDTTLMVNSSGHHRDHLAIPRNGKLTLELLHRRLNHVSAPVLRKLVPNLKTNLCFCDACAVGGIRKSRYVKRKLLKPKTEEVKAEVPDSVPEGTRYVETVAYLLGGAKNPNFAKYLSADTKTSPAVSVRGYKYAYVLTCKETKVTVPFLGVDRNDFTDLIVSWLKNFYNRYARYPAHIHFDQGGEFKNVDIAQFCKCNGIDVTFSCTKAHNQNAIAENRIGVIWVQMLKLLAYSGVPFQFWCFAFVYATMINNHIPHTGINFNIPMESAGLQTFFRWIYIFGSEVFYRDPHALDWQGRAKRGVILGLDLEIKGWVILDILSGNYSVVSRDCVINEGCLPFREASKPSLIMLKFGVWPNAEKLELEERGDKNNNYYNSSSQFVPVPDPQPAISESNGTVPVSDSNGTPPEKLGLDNFDTIELSPIKNTDVKTPLQLDFSQPAPAPESKLPTAEHPSTEVNTPAPENKFTSSNPTDDKLLDLESKLEAKILGSSNLKQDNSSKPGGQKLNLDTPIISKGGLKKFNKIRLKMNELDEVRHYYRSGDKNRMEHYEAELKSELDSKKNLQESMSKPARGVRKIDSETKTGNDRLPAVPEETVPVPEEVVDGKDTWQVRFIKAARPKDGTEDEWEYRVRWKNNWPDQWLDGKELLDCPDILEHFWKNKDKKKRGYKTAPKKRYIPRTMSIKDFIEEPPGFDKEDIIAIPNAIKERAKRELKLALELKDIEFLKDVPRRLLNELKSMVNLSDTGLNRSNQNERVQSLFKKLKDNEYHCLDSTTFHATDEIEEIDLASTQFPKPELNVDGIYNVPSDVDEHEIINICMETIQQLMDDGFIEVPKTRKQAMLHKFKEHFIEAEHKELYEIWVNGTFEFTICPEGRKPIPCIWTYDIKRNDKNEIERFKARLVIQGFKQVEGIDFQKTFSSVAQVRTFRTVLALAIRYNLTITQYDISNAFLNADIDTEIFMTYPPGYPPKELEKLKEVLKLLKGLYGLRQASRLWNKLLVKTFVDAGLQVCKTEPGILRVMNEDTLCLVNLWVDDYLLATNDEVLRTRIEKVMASLFQVKALGILKHYLGVVIDWYKLPDGRRAVKLHQKPYFDRLLAKTGFDKSSAMPTPGAPSVQLSVVDMPGPNDEIPDWPYMSVGGSIMYPTLCTRPEMSFQTNKLSRYNRNPGKTHVNAQKHMLKYIKGTTGRGLIYKEQTSYDGDKVNIVACVDTDWAGCQDTRRSTVGYIVYLDGSPIAWKSKLMTTLALSSCEAEFMGLSLVAREVMWLCRFLTEIGIEYNIPKIYCDSQSAIYWAEDPVQHQRNKHVELKYYYIRDLVSAELVEIWKISGLNNPADPLTKVTDRRMAKDVVPPLMGETEIKFEE